MKYKSCLINVFKFFEDTDGPQLQYAGVFYLHCALLFLLQPLYSSLLVYLCSIFFLRSHSQVVISFVFPMFVLLELQLVILVHLWQCDTELLWSLRLACQYIVRMYSSGFLHFPMWILQSNTSIQLTQSGPINMHGHPAYGPVPALQKIIGWFCPHSQPNSAHPY